MKMGLSLNREQLNTVFAGAALFLSLTLAGGDAVERLRGSEVSLAEPWQVILYLDGPSPQASVVSVGVQLTLVNRSRFGDATTVTTLGLADGKTHPSAEYRAETNITPVFVSSENEAPECDGMSRCLKFRQLIIAERPVTVIELPGGSAHSAFLSFPVSPSNCVSKTPAACRRAVGLPRFRSAVMSLTEPALVVRAQTVSDGNKVRQCRLPRDPVARIALLNQLQTRGWAAFNCRPA